MIRKIVNIDKEKCNGCGACVNACHEGAIQLINGKAHLISDEYCDGLGDCLPECPTDAITIIERDSKAYDEQMVMKKKGFVCPGTIARSIKRPLKTTSVNETDNHKIISELRQWPVQLKLLNTRAPYFKGADLLVAADCTAYAYAGFHSDFIRNHIVAIGCPKLDDIAYYEDKIAEIIENSELKSITVVRMEVPCCMGISNAVKNAMLKTKTIVPYKEVIISTEGNIMD